MAQPRFTEHESEPALADAGGGPDPQLLLVVTSGLAAVVAGVVAIALTDSGWVVAVAFGVLVAGTIAVTADVLRAAGDPRRRRGRRSRAVAPAPPALAVEETPRARVRVVVMTSEPLPAPRVLAAVRDKVGSSVAADDLGVVVVSPEGFGGLEITNDEEHYELARRAERLTVAALRFLSVRAVGHVGDHDAAQALTDALVLFPADHALVFAHPTYAAGYRSAVDRMRGGVPVDLVELAA
jgi:hypothetical protein